MNLDDTKENLSIWNPMPHDLPFSLPNPPNNFFHINTVRQEKLVQFSDKIKIFPDFDNHITNEKDWQTVDWNK